MRNLNSFILSEKDFEGLAKGNNPFGIVMETAWHGIYKRNITDEKLLDLKVDLFRRLRKGGYSRKKIEGITFFIKLYSPFEKKEFYHKFDNIVNSLTGNIKTMGIKEAVYHEIKQKGREEGREEGLSLALEIAMCLKKGEKVKEIAKSLEISEEFVKKVKEDLEL